jgi:hypothetical protein
MTFRLHWVTSGFQPIVYVIQRYVNAALRLEVDIFGILRTSIEFPGITYFLFRGQLAIAVVVSLLLRKHVCEIENMWFWRGAADAAFVCVATDSQEFLHHPK